MKGFVEAKIRGGFLMGEKNRQVLVPSYMKQFACIGPACEDTCCSGWAVPIDQATYKKYNKVRDLELKPLLDKKITRNRSNPSEGNYAKIRLDPDGRCPILSEEGLCNIQAKMGEDLLSDTCAMYPRVTNQVNGAMERSASISCPEIARLVLLNPDGIEFEEIVESTNVRFRFSKRLDNRNDAASDAAEKYFWELRIISIQILQNRNYTVSDRLVILGMFIQKVQEYVEANRVNEIPQLIAEYTRSIEEGTFNEGLRQIPVLNAIQMEIMKEIADERFSLGINNKRYFNSFAEYLHGIQYYEGASVEDIAGRYKSAYETYYKPFIDEHEYILENYMVNYVFRSMFPCGGKSTFDDYIMIVIQYSMIKLQLIGIAGYHKEGFNLDHIVTLIQSFAKSVEHSPLFLRKVFELLKNNGYTSMAYMSILIKN
jgi:lysine-N-methylase